MADNNNVIGLAMELDVSNIKEGVKEVNKIIKSSKDEFNNATAGMDMWSKSSEGLNAKLSQLGKQLSAQEKLAKGYEAEIQRVSESEGDHTEELNRLKGQLQKTQNEIKKTQSQMSHYGESLVQVEREEKDANSALGKLTDTIDKQKKHLENLTKDYKAAVIQYGKNSREAKDLAKQIKNLSDEIEDNESTVEDADNAFAGLSRTFEEVGGKALDKAIKGVAGLGAAITGIVGSFLATAESTREFRTNMGKVNVAFDEAGFSAEQAEGTYKKFYGILGDEGQATEAVSHLAKLTNSQKDLDKWTKIAAGVYATFGDSLPIENLTEAANETAKTGELTGGLADALNWAGVNEDKFQDKLDKCNNESERQALITETLSGLYDEAGDKYKETNKDIIASQEAQAELSKVMAQVGEQAEPIMTQMKLMGAKIMESLLPVIEKLIPLIQDHLPELTVAVGVVGGAITALATTLGLMKLKQDAVEVATTLHTIAMGVNAKAATLLNAVREKGILGLIREKAAIVASTVASKAQAVAAKATAAAQWLLNAAMNANPIGLIIIAITALVAAFVVLWNKSDAFREFWIGLWDDIKKYAKIAIEAIGKFFSACWDGIKKAWSGTTKFFSSVWEGIKKVFSGVVKFYTDLFKKAWEGIKKAFDKTKSFFSDLVKKITDSFKNIPKNLKDFFSKAWDKIKDVFGKVKDFFSKVASNVSAGFKGIPDSLKKIFSNAWGKIKDAFANVKDFFSGLTDKIVAAFKNMPDKMKSIGDNLVKGLWNGINNAKDWVIGKIKGFSSSILKGIENFFGVDSPSKETAKIGDYMAQGLANGLEGRTNDVIKAGAKAGEGYAKGFTSTAKTKLNEGANEVTDSFDKLTAKIEKQEAQLGGLESKYKSIVMTFGETSEEAYAVGKNIITLSRQLEENREKVEKLDDGYKNLHTTLADQMRVELNQAKNQKNTLAAQIAEISKILDEAEDNGTWTIEMTTKLYALEDLKSSLSSVDLTINELTANLDYMAEQQRKAAEKAVESQRKATKTVKTTAKEVEVVKNEYEKLLETIENQKKELEQLRTAYESAAMTFGEHSVQAENLAVKIKKLTGEIADNEKMVNDLDEAYKRLTAIEVEPEIEIEAPPPVEIQVEIDSRTAWQKFIDDMEDALGISDSKMQAWSEGVGKYISKISGYFENVTSYAMSFVSMITDSLDKQASDKIAKIESQIESVKKQTDAEINERQNSANEQLAIIEKMYDKMEISCSEYREKRKAIEQELADFTDSKNKEREESEKKLQQAKDELARKQFEGQQQTSIAQAAINGAAAVIKGFAELPPPAAAINAAMVTAMTAAQIATIASQKYVPMLAKGGIADGATLAMIGEAGKEAVVPLEKNTEWMDKLAEKLAAIMQKDMVSGVQSMSPAYAMSGSPQIVNNYFEQTINSPKALNRRELYRDSKNLLSLKGV